MYRSEVNCETLGRGSVDFHKFSQNLYAHKFSLPRRVLQVKYAKSYNKTKSKETKNGSLNNASNNGIVKILGKNSE